MKTFSLSLFVRCLLVGFGSFLPLVSGFAQAAATAAIEGRILNGASGSYLENAQVIVNGTKLEALTNAIGEYRIANVPSGEISVTVVYSAFKPETKTVTLATGETARLDYTISPASRDANDGVVRLEEFSVNEKRLSGQASALNEERVASNIKNVLSFDEFGEMGESNPGEYLKYVPGISINYGPNVPQFASIRGMPAEGTLVMIDGAPVASSAGDRAFELTGAATNNVDRIEVTKSPTPDMPANAIGGSVNIIGKSGFSRSTPKLDYSAYLTFNYVSGRPGLKPSFSKRAGPDARTEDQPISYGFDLSYIKPVNDKVAVTLTAGAGTRYTFYDGVHTLWNLVSVVDERLMKQDVIVISDRKMAGASLDWRISKLDSVRASFQYSREDFRVSVSTMDYRFGTNASGDETFTQSRPNVGIVANTASAYNSERVTSSLSLGYKHNGPVWKYDAEVSWSQSERENSDTPNGTFSGFTARYTGLTMRSEGRNYVHDGSLPHITATNAAGQTVNVHDAGGMPITGTAAAVALQTDDVIRGARFNISRDFDLENPLKIKAGVSAYEEALDANRQSYAWAMAAPAGPGSNTGRSLNVMSDAYAAETDWVDYLGNPVPVQWISPAKLYEYYLRNPQYFTLNQASSYIAGINNSKFLEETITAGYVSVESKSFNNRLRIVTGVRYEKTEDSGTGPRNDIGATYARAADGSILRNSAGTPIRLSTNALELAQLQYTRRGAASERSYDDFYPSFNGSFQLRDNLAMRFAYAKTIGRPPIRQIMPGIVLPNPTSSSRIITQNNTGLLPWASDSFDITLEAYNMKGATVSVGAFSKKITNFFISTTTPVTADFLVENGLDDEYAGYDVVTKRNGGSAEITGFEFSYRQALNFTPDWARGVHVFVNGTFLSLDGENADDFTGFSPRNVNWGISYARGKFIAKFNVNRSGRVRSLKIASNATIPPDAYRYIAPQTIVDASAEYKFSKYFALYASARNMLQSAKLTEDFAESTPDYARTRVTQRFGAMYTFGIKGEF